MALARAPTAYTQSTHLHTYLPEGLKNESYPIVKSGELALLVSTSAQWYIRL